MMGYIVNLVIVFNTRQYKWNCFQFVSSVFMYRRVLCLLQLSLSCTLWTLLTPSNSCLAVPLDFSAFPQLFPSSKANYTVRHSKQLLLSFRPVSRLVRSIPWSLLCVVLLWTMLYTKMEREGPCWLLMVSEG